eukprot:TRINITY_DN38342_c0_g1_i2.p1 TRINITY_DN38342_c0_g1~~TRINITY_DN38342_c0_g1_i2.p1  ORF type:complete len:1060 (+),score=259.25 TRINITY_DN38342_c0_g1_i2:230-3409(+)
MFTIARGCVDAVLGGMLIRKYKQGQAINTLAVAGESVTPNFAAVCEKTCEVLSLSRGEFRAALMASSIERKRLEVILDDPTWCLVNASKTFGSVNLTKCKEDEGSTEDGMSSESSGFVDVGMEIGRLQLFQQNSLEYVQWIQKHLDAQICAPGELICSEGDEEEERMFIICVGKVVIQGSAVTGEAEELLGPDSTFGEHRFLEVTEAACVTATALETSILQVLHLCVFRKSLQLFPNEQGHFHKAALKYSGVTASDQQGQKLAQIDFFRGCSADFLTNIASLMHTRLVRSGDFLIEAGGNSSDALIILRSGSAVIHRAVEKARQVSSDSIATTRFAAQSLVTLPDYTASSISVSRHLGEGSISRLPDSPRWKGGGGGAGLIRQQSESPPCSEHQHVAAMSVINADVALGLAKAGESVEATRSCVVHQITTAAFLAALRRFPQEVVRLCKASLGAPALWPLESDQVPFFKGVGHGMFGKLLNFSEWQLFLPGQVLVRQGGIGDLLFIICYGTAATIRDRVVLNGGKLGPGDCIGTANVLGVVSKYRVTAKTLSVCHCRVLSAEQLSTALKSHSEEYERFTQLRLQAEQEQRSIAVEQSEQVANAIMRTRVNNAFDRHVVAASRQDTQLGAQAYQQPALTLPAVPSSTKTSLAAALPEKLQPPSLQEIAMMESGLNFFKRRMQLTEERGMAPEQEEKAEDGFPVEAGSGSGPQALKASLVRCKRQSKRPQWLWPKEEKPKKKKNDLKRVSTLSAIPGRRASFNAQGAVASRRASVDAQLHRRPSIEAVGSHRRPSLVEALTPQRSPKHSNEDGEPTPGGRSHRREGTNTSVGSSSSATDAASDADKGRHIFGMKDSDGSSAELTAANSLGQKSMVRRLSAPPSLLEAEESSPRLTALPNALVGMTVSDGSQPHSRPVIVEAAPLLLSAPPLFPSVAAPPASARALAQKTIGQAIGVFTAKRRKAYLRSQVLRVMRGFENKTGGTLQNHELRELDSLLPVLPPSLNGASDTPISPTQLLRRMSSGNKLDQEEQPGEGKSPAEVEAALELRFRQVTGARRNWR